MSTPHITFEIGALVLDGFSKRERVRITESLQAELHTLLRNPRTLAALQAQGRTQPATPSLTIKAGVRPEEIGKRTAVTLLEAAGYTVPARVPGWGQNAVPDPQGRGVNGAPASVDMQSAPQAFPLVSGGDRG